MKKILIDTYKNINIFLNNHKHFEFKHKNEKYAYGAYVLAICTIDILCMEHKNIEIKMIKFENGEKFNIYEKFKIIAINNKKIKFVINNKTYFGQIFKRKFHYVINYYTQKNSKLYSFDCVVDNYDQALALDFKKMHEVNQTDIFNIEHKKNEYLKHLT